MTKTAFKCILLFTILVGLTQAALITYPETQSQPFANNQKSYSQNSLEEPRFPARSNDVGRDLKKKTNVVYDHVDDLGNRVIENFNHRFPDGSYEFRYELADGQARYERGYFIRINNVKSLVVVGYYSYRMPDGKYLTVFYNADHNGYRQNQAITRDIVPDLPRSIEVPAIKDEPLDATTTPRPFYNNASTTTKRNHF